MRGTAVTSHAMLEMVNGPFGRVADHGAPPSHETSSDCNVNLVPKPPKWYYIYLARFLCPTLLRPRGGATVQKEVTKGCASMKPCMF